MSKLTPDDTFNTYAWMVDNLNLEGTELTIYAIIYKYSSNPEVGCYYGSQQYLCDWTKKSKPTVQKALNNLTERNLIIKEEIWQNGIKFCKYTINREAIEITWGYVNNLHTDEKGLINNIYNNINNINNNKDNINVNNLHTGKDLVEELFNDYTENNDLYDVLMEFRDYRKEKKSPLTERAAKGILKELDKLKTDKEKIQCIERSIMSGWTGVFANKENNTPKKKNLHDESDLKGVIRPTKRRIDS